ncbi:hypothetical protein EBT25_05855 [bacterium]|nr:hypothetical protein [bacterium]
MYHDHTFVDQQVVHTNSIESFWAYAKHTLRPRKGLPYEAYSEHIKMTQKRYDTFENKKLRLNLRRILKNYH